MKCLCGPTHRREAAALLRDTRFSLTPAQDKKLSQRLGTNGYGKR